MRSISASTTQWNFDVHILARLVDVSKFGFHSEMRLWLAWP
jgi:hypothetical protein